MSSGQFINQNGKLGTTYPESPYAMEDLIEDFYGAAVSKFMKSAGHAGYGDGNNGYFNPIFGKYITAAMFMNDNVFTALGARPYTTEGVRISTEAATYGLASAADATALGVTEGDFVGIGATTLPDGDIPGSVAMPVNEFREPSKELPLSFDYGMYLAAVENKDDVVSKKDYLDLISRNYSDLVDKTLMRPVSVKQPMLNGQETSLNGLDRIVSGFSEIGRTVGTTTLTAEDVSPYGGRTATHGDFYAFRSAATSNLDSNIVDAAGSVLKMEHMRDLYRACQVNWSDSGAPNNKVFFMSNVALDVLGAMLEANQRYLNTVYVQRDFGGVKTIPGRDAGLTLKSYNNIPIIQTGNANFDYTTKRVSSTRMGNIMLLDLDHIWMSMLSPVSLYTADNPAITRTLRERNVLHMRMETRVDSFIQHGKIVGLADDA